MKIGIIGSGNMASAFVSGFLASGIEKEKIFLSDIDKSKLSLWEEKGIACFSDNLKVVSNADIIFLAVKPNILPNVLKEISVLKKDKIFVSMAAGFTIMRLEENLGKETKIIRIMPNTPVFLRCGMIVLTSNNAVLKDEKDYVLNLLSSVGEVAEIDEKDINAATALHGSGPAYIYMMIDAMANAGVSHGLDKETAVLLAAKAVEGSAKMVLNSDEDIIKLRDNVCSPGGTTIEAVLELQKNGFESCVEKAIDKCVKKANSM